MTTKWYFSSFFVITTISYFVSKEKIQFLSDIVNITLRARITNTIEYREISVWVSRPGVRQRGGGSPLRGGANLWENPKGKSTRSADASGVCHKLLSPFRESALINPRGDERDKRSAVVRTRAESTLELHNIGRAMMSGWNQGTPCVPF